MCDGCLIHFVNISNYNIYSNKRWGPDIMKIKRRFKLFSRSEFIILSHLFMDGDNVIYLQDI